MTKQRRTFRAEEKVKILRLHLIEKQPISDVCEQYGVNPNMFYRWQKQFFENGVSAFDVKAKVRNDSKLERKLKRLEEKLTYKDEVIAEIIEDHIRLKKSLGED